MNIFQSKQECFIREVLKTRGFFEEDIANCDIEGIANNIFIHHAFKDFVSVVICTPLAHFTLAKAILVLLSWMQVDHQVSDNAQLCAFIAHLSRQAGQLAKNELVENRTLVRGMSSKQLLQRVGNMFQNNQRGAQNPETSSVAKSAFLTHHLLQPLLSIAYQIYAHFEQVYCPSVQMNDQLCWTMLNLLNKYGELHKSFEGVGRYYKNEFLPLVLQTLKVIDEDIQMLYRRVTDYLTASIKSIEVSIMTGKHSRLSAQEEARISLMEIFIGEIDQLNDNFRVIYLGKYFRKELESIGLYSPHIFRGSELLDVFDTFRNYQKALPPSKTYRSCQTIASDQECQVSVINIQFSMDEQDEQGQFIRPE